MAKSVQGIDFQSASLEMLIMAVCRCGSSSYLSLPSQARIKQLDLSAADTGQSANTVIEIAGGSLSGQSIYKQCTSQTNCI